MSCEPASMFNLLYFKPPPYPTLVQNKIPTLGINHSLAGNKSFPRWEKTTSGNCKKHIQETFDGLYRTRDKQTK